MRHYWGPDCPGGDGFWRNGGHTGNLTAGLYVVAAGWWLAVAAAGGRPVVCGRCGPVVAVVSKAVAAGVFGFCNTGNDTRFDPADGSDDGLS